MVSNSPSDAVIQKCLEAIEGSLMGAPGYEVFRERMKSSGFDIERRQYQKAWWCFSGFGERIRESALPLDFRGDSLLALMGGPSSDGPSELSTDLSGDLPVETPPAIPITTPAEVAPIEVDLPGDPAKRLMLYWRNSLADESRLGVSQQLAEGLPVSWGEVIQGTFGPAFMAQARTQWKVGELDPIGPIVICPVHLQPRVSHGFARQAADATPFWIPGFLDKDGAVNPTSFGAWVCRENLAPSDGEALLVGTLEAQDQYLSRTPLPMDGGEGGWQKCMDWAQGLFHAVIGGNPRDVAFDGYDKSVLNGSAIPTCIVIRIDSSMRMVASLVGAYDWFVKQPELPLLMKQAASLTPRVEAGGPVTLSKEEQLQWSRAHLGQLKGSFPLSESQRESLIHHLSLGGRGILAVNGPPGTGKTTLLHSMIANRVVEAALQKGEAPVIVASSTNNTAVKNVIESLSNPKETNPLAQRWLPGIVHFGCYMPSRDKLEKATKDGYQAFNSGDQGFMADKCSGAYLGEAERYFLERFRQAGLGEVSSAEEASEALHLRLREVVGKLTRLYELWDEYKQALVRYSSLVGGRTGVAAQFNAANHAVSRSEALLRAWLVVDQGRSWWSRAFHFVPFVKAQEMSRRQAFLALQGLECPNRPALEDLNGWVIRHLDDCRGQAKRLEEQLLMIRGGIASARNTVHQYQEVRKSLGLPRNLWKAQGQLDTTLRVQAFNLAARYWEARWLMDIREKVDVGGGWNIRKPADKKTFFRHVAKVAPCMVVTLHRLPSEFSFGGTSNKSYFSEFIDLLVLDESGQVAPQVGSVSFAFAKCAVVVGDIKQIAPVRKMQGAVDEANIRRHGLLEAGEMPGGHTALEGTLLEVAQWASPYSKFKGVRGMFLSEHRRCTDQLMGFCNDIAYAGRLKPMTGDITQPPLPAWGYASVPGQSRRGPSGVGLCNPTEAATIAQWVKDNESTLLGYLDPDLPEAQKTLANAVAVVTPYALQREALAAAFKEACLPGDITVGTVHALQGAERPVVIFSPVFTRADTGTPFFDRPEQSPSMLNVAVSRAKKSFLVFGDMEVFARRASSGSLPSALLAKYLFGAEGNGLRGYQVVLSKHGDPLVEAHRLQGLEAHFNELREAFFEARERVVVVSPWLSAAVVEHDKLPELVQAAVDRRVRVQIFSDRRLNEQDGVSPGGPLRERAAKAEQLLLAAGASISWARNIHNKTLVVDDHHIVEGSFNWLSAARDPDCPYARMESSIRYGGPKVKEWALDLLSGLEERGIAIA